MYGIEQFDLCLLLYGKIGLFYFLIGPILSFYSLLLVKAYMNIYRWFIEASSLPNWIFLYLSDHYFQCTRFDKNTYQFVQNFGMIFKILLFICIRYDESQLDFSLYKTGADIVSLLCELFSTKNLLNFVSILTSIKLYFEHINFNIF